MNESANHIYEFGPFRLDVAERMLLRDGAAIPLQPKAFDLLLVLVQNHGHLLEKDELLKTVWPDTIVEEVNLANNISTLRKALGEGGNGQQFIETVPRRGYRFVAPVREEQEEAVGPGVAEIAQAPVAAATGEPPAQGVSRWMKRRPGLAVSLAILLLMGAAGAINSWSPKRQPTAPGAAIRSIAVLPFKPLVAESHDEALQMGMADTLILKLSGLNQLRVRSISSVRKYINPEQDPLAAGREQKVDFVLDSSFQRDGERIRVTARLLNVADGTALATYQCDEQYCANVFVMQDTISEKVAAALALQLTGAEQARLRKHYTENREAYQLYLRGMHHMEKRTEKDFEKSIDYYQQAIRIDPNYALAYAGLADAYHSLGYSSAPPKDVVPKAKAALAKALEIDDQLAEAHTVLGLIKYTHDWDRPGAEKAFKRALELNPNSEIVHRLYALFFMSSGRFDEALAEVNRALDLDPVSVIDHRNKGMILHLARQYDRAIEQLQKTLELNPNLPMIYVWLEQAYAAKGDYEQAIAADLKQTTLSGASPEEVAALRGAYTASGWKGYWRKKLDSLKEKAKQGSYVEPYEFVLLYVRLGEKDQAFAWLEKSYQERNFDLNAIEVNPFFDGLRSDPRYRDLLRRMRLPVSVAQL